MTKISETQAKLLNALVTVRNEQVKKDLKNWGLRAAIETYRAEIIPPCPYELKKDFGVRFNRRSLEALQRAGMIEYRWKCTTTTNRWVNPFTRSVCFKDHYSTAHYVRLTKKGSLEVKKTNSRSF